MLERKSGDGARQKRTLSHAFMEVGKEYDDRLSTVAVSLIWITRRGKAKKNVGELDALISCILSRKVPGDDVEELEDLLFFYEAYGAYDTYLTAEHILEESEFMHCRICYFDPSTPAVESMKKRELQKLKEKEPC